MTEVKIRELFKQDLEATEAWLATHEDEPIDIEISNEIWDMVTELATKYDTTPKLVFCMAIYCLLHSEH